MAKLLNIDELVTPEKAIKIKNQTYTVVERSVEQLITATRLQRNAENAQDEIESLEQYVKLINMSIPDCPADVLRQLPILTLNKISDFLHESEVLEELSDEGEGEGEGK